MNPDWLGGVNWGKVLLPDTPLLEIFVRGTLTYFAIYILLRVVLKRETGGVDVTDVLVIVLIADAAQNAMAGDYTSVPDGILLVATIIGWSATVTWLGYKFPIFERLVHSAPLPLVKDGQLLRRNMAREFVTKEEIESQLRLHGLEELSDAKLVFMESDGQFSIIAVDGRDTEHRQRPAV